MPAFAYNRHFQPTKIYATINNSTSSFLFMDCYNWGAPNADGFIGSCPTWSGTNDNGNLYGRVSYEGGPATQGSLTAYTDTFSYDGLNRLTLANDSGGWSRAFNYDSYGNMWVTNPTGPGLNSATPTEDVYNSKNQMSTATYDASGNQLTMGPYTLGYDAEGQQVSESNTIGNPAATYAYDGAGNRVIRSVSAQTTVYVYDAFGALAAAYSNGAMGTPPCHTCYLTYDQLGSTRMITDSNANVIARHDYLPFGEEIPGGIAGRSAAQFGPGLDNINEKFTGQERDSESGLDFFHARYFGGALGRFLSPDPANAGANPLLPQSWNAYAYVANNPLNAIDPSGSVACLARSPHMTGCGVNGQPPGSGGNSDEFDFINIPIVTQVWTGPQTVMPPDVIYIDPSNNGIAITSATITYSPLQTTPGTLQTMQIGTGADLIDPYGGSEDVAIDIDIFHGQQKLWSNTAGVGNTAAAGTAAVLALPVVVAGASTALTSITGWTAQGIGWAQGTFGAGTGVVIGSYNQINNYIESGESVGANYFSVPELIWNVLARSGQSWTANQAFLDASIARGQQFFLSTNPLAAEGSFATELDYLTGQGIGPNQWQMVPLPIH